MPIHYTVVDLNEVHHVRVRRTPPGTYIRATEDLSEAMEVAKEAFIDSMAEAFTKADQAIMKLSRAFRKKS